MNVTCIGGGPAGLQAAILLKKSDPARRVRVFERDRPDDTFGFGVVFSDATLGNLQAADPDTYRAITRRFAHWDDIDVHIGGKVFRSTGHGFCGLSRKTLLAILQQRCRDLGVELCFEHEIDDLSALGDEDLVIAADGVGSKIRDAHAAHFQPELDWRPNRFVWLGTTFPFEAFTFYFDESEHGLFRVHAYRFEEGCSTFIVECTEDTWRRAGLDAASEDETIAYLERVFAHRLDGHRLIKNKSIWRSFPTIRCGRWHHDNIVLVGDAVHTAHFSIGSGTKLAMEDCIALVDALDRNGDLPTALVAYEAERRPEVEKLQRAAQISLEWFENTERYTHLEPIQFAYSLLTRSLRVTHENLRRRDPELVAEVEQWFSGAEGGAPLYAPLRLRELQLRSRIVAAPRVFPPAEHGGVSDAHLVHAGARAWGGAALVMLGVSAVPGPDAALASEAHAAALGRVASFVHGAGAALGVSLAGGDIAAKVRAAGLAAEAGVDYLELDFGPRSGTVPGVPDRDVADIARAVRAAWPADRPLGVRLGLRAGDADAIVAPLREAGCDLVVPVPVDQGKPSRLGQVPLADEVRNRLAIPTVAAGGVWSTDDANSVLAAGRADLCSLGAALDFDPNLPRRAARASGVNLPWPAPYARAAGHQPRD